MARKDLVASAAYQPEPTAAAAARRFVRDTLQSWVTSGKAADGHGLVDDAVLLTSELVTNAVVHAGTPVRVTCKLSAGEVEVVVSDGHPGRLVPEMAGSRHDATERTSGRGLLLPAALASSWGVSYGRSAKAVWFRLGLEGPSPVPAGGDTGGPRGRRGSRDGLTDQEVSLASLLSPATQAMAVMEGVVTDPAPRSGRTRPAGEPGYRLVLAETVASARAEVGADAAVALMVDEEGDLRLRAVCGSLAAPGTRGQRNGTDGLSDGLLASLPTSGPAAPSVLTVPFLVDGRVTGLLSAVSAASGSFSDADQRRLQSLAEGSGPVLQRAWLGEMERIRRGRMAALAEASGLLGHGLAPQDIMALAARVTVPRLAPWCAVLLPGGTGALRLAHAQHVEADRREALTWLFGRLCEGVEPEMPGQQPGNGPGWRWPLSSVNLRGAPRGARELATEVGWSFPLGTPQAGHGFLVIGSDCGSRLPREVAALAADLACRIGLALSTAAARPGAPAAAV